MSVYHSHRDVVAPLDESLYKLEGEELEFYRRETGIQDEEQLKQHILAVQKEAYEVSRMILCDVVNEGTNTFC